MELIELRELQPEPRPGRGRLERTNALRISPARRLGPGAHPDPRLTAAPGAGHRFEPRRRGLHTWCDLCGDFVWGGGRKSLQCRREYRAAPPAARHPPPGHHRASHQSYPGTGHPGTSTRAPPPEHRASHQPYPGTGHPATRHPTPGIPPTLPRHWASRHPYVGHWTSQYWAYTPGTGDPSTGHPYRDPSTGHPHTGQQASWYRAPPRGITHPSTGHPHWAQASWYQFPTLATRHSGTGHPHTGHLHQALGLWAPGTGHPSTGHTHQALGIPVLGTHTGVPVLGTPSTPTRYRASGYLATAPGILGAGTEHPSSQAPTLASPGGGARAPQWGPAAWHSTMSHVGAGPWVPGTAWAGSWDRAPVLAPRTTPLAQLLALTPRAMAVTPVLSPSPDCSFTCHYRCRALVRLDCSGPPGAGDEDDGTEQALEKDTNVDEPSEWEKAELDQAQVEQRIKEYNSQINSNLFMSLNKDGSYTGFIKVQLKLVRPVSVPATKRVPSLQAGRPGPRTQGVKRRTSFYLPKGTVKHLHILSHTRASEVIDALLRKFTVIDNPRKFALFERSEKDEQVYLRKLADEEQPLRLRLLAGPSEKVLSFVLKENETGEVNWDAFTLPELHNFLRILQREEEEHVRRLRHRYARCRQKMQEALSTHTPG